MSYISKNTGAFVNARITDKGRELLSLGLLNFATYRLGDSEVDYTTLGAAYNISLQNVLKAKADQPELKTPLFPTANATSPDVSIGDLQPIELSTIVASPEKGFFIHNSGTTATTIQYTAYTTTDYLLEPNTMVPVSGMSGTNTVNVYQTGAYVSGFTEPSVGDLMMVKMSNPDLTDLQSVGVVELNTPVPYLWYKVQSLSGSVSADTLVVVVDRNLPDFAPYTSSNMAHTMFYPQDDWLFDTGLYSGGTVWNMNNVWTYNIPGIDVSVYEGFENYGSESFVGPKEYYGYTSEKQLSGDTAGFCNDVNSISIIHFSNVETCSNIPEQIYGQKFYVDTSISESPLLEVPTLMWHRREFSGSGTGDIIGQTFVATGNTKAVTLDGSVTGIKYYDLVDEQSPDISVGRLFPELQTITIDDQELVAALSYKSNRNWTLPTVEYGLTTATKGYFSQTQDVYVTYLLSSTSGYTSGLHNQNLTCVTFGDEDCPPDASRKNIDITFPTGQLPYMTVTGGTGWYADEFHILVQSVPTGDSPNPANWTIMDYTASIDNHTVGTRIDPINLESTTYTISTATSNSGSTYNLNDYIDIPEIGETDILQFGDEQFFYGNMEASGLIRNYRTEFNFTIAPQLWNWSQNPTYPDSGQNVHVSEIGVYDNVGNLVAIGKFITPIEKTNVTTILLQMALDF